MQAGSQTLVSIPDVLEKKGYWGNLECLLMTSMGPFAAENHILSYAS